MKLMLMLKTNATAMEKRLETKKMQPKMHYDANKCKSTWKLVQQVDFQMNFHEK